MSTHCHFILAVFNIFGINKSLVKRLENFLSVKTLKSYGIFETSLMTYVTILSSWAHRNVKIFKFKSGVAYQDKKGPIYKDILYQQEKNLVKI